jgi:hypothetical protein
MNLKRTTLLLVPAAMLLLTACGEASLPPVDIDATVEARAEERFAAIPAPTARVVVKEVVKEVVVEKEVLVEKIVEVVVTATPTPASEPTATPTPTPPPPVPPTASPRPSISKPGKMTATRTYSGADECLAISSENAFCVEILAFDVDIESLEKIHEGLDWATRLFPVSRNELTTPIGIQDYLGIVLWNHETSDIELAARDVCLFRFDLGDARDADCIGIMIDRLLRTASGAKAGSASFHKDSGFSIFAPYQYWSRYADDDLSSHRGDFRKILSHEYFHSYQQAHRLRVPDEPLVALWLREGSAEFAANVVAATAGWIDWEFALLWRMKAIQTALRAYPELSISMNITKQQRAEIEQQYHHVVTYEMGFWATAFAADISSKDAILKDYWDDLEKYGWEKSFERNVGYSVQEFYLLFEAFLLDHADDENFDWLRRFSLID